MATDGGPQNIILKAVDIAFILNIVNNRHLNTFRRERQGNQEVTLKIGFIQFAPVLGDVGTTMEKLDRLLDSSERADLIVLPELCNSGYHFADRDQAWDTSEEVGQSRFITYLTSKCREANLFIVSGFNERAGKHLYNSAVLVGPEGYVGRYRKGHLFMNEKDYFLPGDEGIPVFDTGKCRVGMLVCFDWIFPEVWRVLALKGADIICHPSNLVLPGLAQRAIPLHAMTNRVYIVTANRIGTERDLTFTGRSVIADPKGEILIEGSEAGEEICIIEIDPALAREKMITPRNHLFEDRRPELYQELVR
jgi:predicted amidohydrolase